MKRRADIRNAAMARIEQIVGRNDADLASAVREIVKQTQAELEAFKTKQALEEAARIAAKAGKLAQIKAPDA